MNLKKLCIVPMVFWLACGGTDATKSPQGLGAVSKSASLQLKAVASGDSAAPVITNQDSAALAVGQQITDGATLRTSSTGRASLEGGDFRRFEVNANTELRVGAGNIKLTSGEVFIETPPAAKKTMTIELPQGTLTTEGAAVDIRHSGESTEINVLRGQVSLQARGGQMTVRAAEKAIISADGTAKKSPSADFTMLTQWTMALQRSADNPQRVDDTLPPPGFGTLSAKTPGTTKERPFTLLSQRVTVTINDQIAKTEVEEVFENPSDVVVEGSFRFTLPEGASINRYAMYVKDTLMEGEIVDRERGRQILKSVIDEFLEEQARLRDPALTEWTEGNTFSTRIFPILPREKKRVILAYTQRLDTQDGKTRYVYPLAVAGTRDKIEKFSFEANVSSGQGGVTVDAPLYAMKTTSERSVTTARFEANNFQAPTDLVLDVLSNSTERATLATSPSKSGDPFFLLSLRPEFTAEEQQAESQRWLFLLDSSQSQTTTQLAIQRGLLPVLFASLDYQDQVKVLTYDYTTNEITSGYTQVSDTLGKELSARLASVEPAGATNLAKALETAAEAAEGKPVRVVIFGDLSPSVGEIRPAVLAERAKKLFAPGSTLSTVGIGSSVDDLVLEGLPQAMGGVSYRVTDGEDLTNAAARILSGQLRPVLSDVRVRINGVETKEVYPSNVSTLALGRELVLVGRYQGQGKGAITLTGRVGTKPFEQTYQANFSAGSEGNRFIAPLWAKERIDALTMSADASARAEIVALSKEMGVMSRYTSFIVLENDAMYKEFGVEQQAKARKQDDAESTSARAGGVTYDSVEPDEAPGADADDASLSDETSAPSAKPAPSAPRKLAPTDSPKTEAKKDPASSGDALGNPFAKDKKSDTASTKSPAKKPSLGSGASMDPFGEGFEVGSKGRRRPSCRTVLATSYRVGPPKVTEATEKELAALRAKVSADVLVRSSHQKLVSKLMSAGRFPEALEAATAWRRLDPANLGLLQTMGELYRLGGRPEEALRISSGALDIDPENADTVELLALYATAKGHPEEAYALRLGRALRKPNDPATQLALAEAAAKDKMHEEVVALLAPWVEVDAKGKLKIKVKLSGAQKTLALRLYSEALGATSGASSSKALGAILAETPSKANLSVELTWEGDADLDLWVAGPKGRPLFGEGFTESRDGKTPETLLAAKAKMGRYRVQVFDASAKRVTSDIKGKVTIIGFKGSAEKKKEISFTLTPGGGLELGSVSLSTREECRYY